MFIDWLRFGLAVMLWATIPAGVAYWLLLHGFVGYWRRVGPAPTWLVIVPTCLVIMAAFWRWGGGIVERSDLGTNMWLFAGGVVLWGISVILDRRTRDQLDTATMLGVREVKADAELLERGIYGRVRHPRYLSLIVAAVGWAMMANHGASWLMVAALVPAMWIVIAVEEQELEERFGGAYVAYRARVPAVVPRPRSPGSGSGSESGSVPGSGQQQQEE